MGNLKISNVTEFLIRLLAIYLQFAAIYIANMKSQCITQCIYSGLIEIYSPWCVCKCVYASVCTRRIVSIYPDWVSRSEVWEVCRFKGQQVSYSCQWAGYSVYTLRPDNAAPGSKNMAGSKTGIPVTGLPHWVHVSSVKAMVGPSGEQVPHPFDT